LTAYQRFSRLVLAATLASALLLAFMPAAAAATETRERRSDITITNDTLFDAAHGVRSGTGTAEDPYVISGWDLNRITIKDTSSHVIITNNSINSTLTLDWIGPGAHVHDNTINDLRVNQNVRRTGEPTSGVIAHNTFRVVGQLRHFDGVFEENVVGSPRTGVQNQVLDEFSTFRAVNFDGFNGAQFRNNTIFGYVETRLHGHHHSSGHGEDSHQHSGDMDMVDHSQRYHEVWVYGNTITVPAGSWAALEYVDNNHAGNDRTATSETNEALNDPHVHYTRVHLTDNTLIGAGLAVEIFNADDERHIDTARGRIDIDGNTIQLPERLYPFGSNRGIYVRDARDVDLYIRGNHIEGPHTHNETPFIRSGNTGIDLSQIDEANVRLYDNMIMHQTYGIYANGFRDVTWFVDGTSFEEVEESVVYSGVNSEPQPRSADPEDDTYEPPPPDEHGGH